MSGGKVLQFPDDFRGQLSRELEKHAADRMNPWPRFGDANLSKALRVAGPPPGGYINSAPTEKFAETARRVARGLDESPQEDES